MHNKRKILVVNKPFQYQHGLLIAVLAALVVELVIVIRIMQFFEEGYTLHWGYILLLIGVQIGFLYGVWRASIIITHRLAGPVYAIGREIRRIGQGDLTARVLLRDKDRFNAECAEINKSFTELQARLARIKQTSAKLQGLDGTPEEISRLLRELQLELDQIKT